MHEPSPNGYAETPMSVSYDGPTAEELAQRQAALHARLVGDLPDTVSDTGLLIELTEAELEPVVNRPATPPLRIGVVRALAPPAVLNGVDVNRVGPAVGDGLGTLVRGADGGLIWSLRLESADAGAIRVHLQNLSLPEGAELYFFGLHGEAYGPYTGQGPDGTGAYWTESIADSAGILQLYLPPQLDDEDLASVRIDVTEIAHISAEFVHGLLEGVAGVFCGNPVCLDDATCYNISQVDAAKNAIAMMQWVSGPFVLTCSGGLLTDNNPLESNFFLTANHCISTSGAASNIEFFWRFRTSTCNGTCPNDGSWGLKTIGSQLKVTNATGDFTLLRLNSNPPSGSAFLGWSTTPVAFSNGAQLYRISNPNYGPQVYSQHNVDTVFGACGGLPRGTYIYSRNITGAIDGGSSGSPVLNSSGLVVGQLLGLCGSNPENPCAAGPGQANAIVDGALAAYFSQIQTHIDPPPVITQHPSNQTVCQGEQATFTVSAGGATPLNYQWRKNGMNIGGATSSTLVINNAQPSDAATYTCFITNAYGNALSNGGVLTVLTNAGCNDGLYCNGVESCLGGVCVDNADPCPQACKESTDACQPYGTMTCQMNYGASPGNAMSVDLFLSQVLGLVGYQARIAITPLTGSGSVTVDCPNGAYIDTDRSDYVFFGLTSFNASHCPNLSVVSAVQTPVEVPLTPKYLATYWLQVSVDAVPGSTFEVSIMADPADTFLREGVEMPIPFNIGPPCILTVTNCASVFGDVKSPQDGLVNLDDILCVLGGFSNLSLCPLGDIHPCPGNGAVTLDDILWVLAAFAGADYCCGQ
jgi:hypothetical protein